MSSTDDASPSDELIGSVAGLWRRRDALSLQPALILVCGAISNDDYQAIRSEVEARLGLSFPADLVIWQPIQKTTEDLSKTIRDTLGPLRLLTKREEFVARGLVPDLLDEAGQLPLRVIVVCRIFGPEEADGLSSLLEQISDLLSKSLQERAEKPILIAVGDAATDLPQSAKSGYWPRFRVGAQALGDLDAGPLRGNEATQTLIVALLTSELLRVIDRVVDERGQSAGQRRQDAGARSRQGDSHDDESDAAQGAVETNGAYEPSSAKTWGREDVAWIIAGASALSVDIQSLRRFHRDLVFQSLIQPLVLEKSRTTAQQSALAEMQNVVVGFHGLVLNSAIVASARQSWQFETEDRRITRVRLDAGTQLWAQIDEATANLRRSLTEHYIAVQRSLLETLPSATQAGSTRILERIASFLYREAATDAYAPNLPAQTVPGAEPAAMLLGNDGSGPYSSAFTETWGLPLTIQAADSAINLLRSSSDLSLNEGGRDVLPLMLGSDRFLGALAEANSLATENDIRRYTRSARSVSSALGLLLRLLPGWPLLAGTIVVITGWALAWAGVVSGICLAAIAIVEMVLIRNRLIVWRRRLRNDVMRRIADSVLEIMAKALWEQRRWAISRLQELRFRLASLTDLLRRDYEDARREELDVENRIRAGVAPASIYRLGDLVQCRTWADSALGKAREEQILTALLRKCISPLLTQSSSLYRATEQIQTRIDDLAAEFFYADLLEPYIVAENVPELAEGKRWRWLFRRAHPLGLPNQVGGPTFTVVVVAGGAALTTASGAQSEHWKSDWKVALSVQPHENICLRGVIELNAISTEPDWPESEGQKMEKEP